MTQEEILDYNKRCAEFLGVDRTLSSYYLPQFGLYQNRYGEIYYEEVFREDELKFHSDWNWIMEVVEAITKYYNGKEIPKIHLLNMPIFAPKEAVVKAINQFLIWYEQTIEIVKEKS